MRPFPRLAAAARCADLKNGAAYGRTKARTDRGRLEVDVQKTYGALHAGYLAPGWDAGGCAIAD